MNKFLCGFIAIGLIGFISCEGTSNNGKNENTQTSTFVPAATSSSSSSSSTSSSETAILNNQAYDPNIFSTFVPQDAVQQYVSQYGAGYTGQALEGFLIPTFDRIDLAPAPPTLIAILKSFLPGPKIIFAIVAKLVGLLASAIGIVFFGGAITSFVCAFTPLCTITFLGKPLALLRKETKDMVEKIGEEITADRVKRAADLFKLAIDKYQKMQQKS